MPEGTTPAGQPNPALPLPVPHTTAARPGGTARLWAWLLVLALALGAGAAAWRFMGAEPGPVADAQRMPAGTVVTEAALAVPSNVASRPPRVTVAEALPITNVPVAVPW